MKNTFIIIFVIITSIGLVSCTGLDTGPSYPVVSTGAPIHQSHYRHPYHYRHRRYVSAPIVHVGGGDSGITQSHY